MRIEREAAVMSDSGKSGGTGVDPVYRVMWRFVIPLLFVLSYATIFAFYAFADQRDTFGHPIGVAVNTARILVVLFLWAGIAGAGLRRELAARGRWYRIRCAVSVGISGLCAIGLLILIEWVSWLGLGLILISMK